MAKMRRVLIRSILVAINGRAFVPRHEISGQYAAEGNDDMPDHFVGSSNNLLARIVRDARDAKQQKSMEVDAAGNLMISDLFVDLTRKSSPELNAEDNDDSSSKSSLSVVRGLFPKHDSSGQFPGDGNDDIPGHAVDSASKLLARIVRDAHDAKQQKSMEIDADGNAQIAEQLPSLAHGNIDVSGNSDFSTLKLSPSFVRTVGMATEGSDTLNKSHGTNQLLKETTDRHEFHVASAAQKLMGRAKYETQALGYARKKMQNASSVVPDNGANPFIFVRRDFNSQHRMPMKFYPSGLQMSDRQHHTWAKHVMLHSALLHSALLRSVLLLAFLFLTTFLTGALVLLIDSFSFDFEIFDSQSGGVRLYKWVWESHDGVGVEAVTGSHVFGDYHHIAIALTTEGVTELLTSHGCLQSVKPYIPDILWDCIRQTSRFMGTRDESSILLIRDSVLIRFSYRSHLLVERVQGRRDESASYAIPTLDKILADSPEKAAEQWCKKSLHLNSLKKHIRFIESGEETEYIDKYEGLRTVERRFVVIVQLLLDNPEMPSFPANQPLLWVPLSEIESYPQIPKHIAFAEVNLWVGGKLHAEIDVCELEDFLKSNGVDTTEWTGLDGTNTSESLLKEINLGQCILKLEGAAVKRVINLAALRLRLHGESDTLLVEVGKRERGAIQWRMQVPGTKQKIAETMEAAAQRICKEQFGLSEEDFGLYPETSREYILNASPSKTYPGIMTAYYTHLVTVDLFDQASLASSNPNFDSCVTRHLRKLQRVSPRKIGTLW